MADGAAAVLNTEVWVSEQVTNQGDTGLYASLKLSSAGQPHVLYWTDLETPAAKLVLAHRDPVAGWLNETIPTARGAQAVLAFDSNQRPVIAYYDLDAATINVGVKIAGFWQIDPVPGMLRSFAIGTTSLVLIGDLPLVSYWSEAGLEVARPAATSFRPRANDWRTERVDADARCGFNHSMALDAQGVPSISYFDLEAQALKLATRNNANFPTPAGWTTRVLDGVAAGEYNSIALNPVTHDLHVAYSSSAGLRHVIAGAGHTPELVDPGVATGLYCSIAFDSQGRPHIAYYDSEGGALKVAHFFNTWQVVTVDHAGDVGGFASLVAVSDGILDVTYYDWTRLTLSFAHSVPPPKAVIRQIAPPGGRPNFVQLDGSGSTPDADTLRFEWTPPSTGIAALPDGTGNRTLQVQFINSALGSFLLTLRVTDLPSSSRARYMSGWNSMARGTA